MSKTLNVVDLRKGPTGLGDILVSLRDAQCGNGSVFILPEKARRFAFLFDGVAPVLVSDTFPEIKTTERRFACYSPGDDVVSQAKNDLSKFSNPIALKVNCSLAWRHIREAPIAKWVDIVKRLKDSGFQVIQYGVSGEVTKIDVCESFLDLPIPLLAAHYKVIGKYVGVDTGDMHLAISVGARCFVAIPSECNDYNYAKWHYHIDSVTYVNFSEMHRIYDLVASK